VARLTGRDYRKVLDVLYAAGEVDGPVAFPEPVLRTLRDVVPCDVVTFHERSRSRDRLLVYTGEPVGPLTPEIRRAKRLLDHENPVLPVARACALTDVVSMRDFRRLELYRDVHRPFGIEYMLWLYLDPASGDARFEFDRADTDFTQRDRHVLNLLLPHLRQQLVAARSRAPARGATGLTPREREIVGYVAEGRTNVEIARLLTVSRHTVRKHLENVYEKLGVHTRTGAVAAIFGHRAAARGESLDP
jgi:DNA-binding CsgD family transcriptional regulator